MDRKLDRRKFISAAVGGALVAAAGYGYYANSKLPAATQTLPPTPTQTSTSAAENRVPNAAFVLGVDSVSGETYYLLDELSPMEVSPGLQPEIPKDLPRWNINPTTEQVVRFLNKSTDPDNDNLTYVWSLNGKQVSRERDLSAKLPEGKNTARLTISDGKLESQAERTITIDPSQIFTNSELKVPIKGINYAPPIRTENRRLTDEQLRLNFGYHQWRTRVQWNSDFRCLHR